jgi:hypothetical protein
MWKTGFGDISDRERTMCGCGAWQPLSFLACTGLAHCDLGTATLRSGHEHDIRRRRRTLGDGGNWMIY